MSLKFKNPGEQEVIVSCVETGQSARFAPGDTVEVPDILKTQCLAKNLTLVATKGNKQPTQAAPVATTAADDDNESTVNAG